MTNTEEIKRLAEIIMPLIASYQTHDFTDRVVMAAEISERILAAGYLPSPSVVSPLVWEWIQERELWISRTSYGVYDIWFFVDVAAESSGYAVRLDEVQIGVYKTLDEAKQRAFDYHTTLIGSCLQGGGYTEEQVREALRVGVNIGMQNVEAPRHTGDYNFNQEKALKECNDYLTALKQQ